MDLQDNCKRNSIERAAGSVDLDVIFITQAECIDYSRYANLPLDRIEEYRDLVYPRMVYHNGGFRSHLDILNYCKFGKYYQDAKSAERRELYNIWNLPGFSGVHNANYLSQFAIKTFVINNIDSEEDFFEESLRSCRNPPLVALSCTFFLSFNQIKRITKRLKKICPELQIVIGGAFVNGFHVNGTITDLQRHMGKLGISYALYSYNSEKDLKNLVLELKKDPIDQNISKVNNLVYRDNDVFKVTDSQWNEPVLQEVPARIDNVNQSFINRTIQLRLSSGCMFHCSFCSYPVTSKGYHPSDIELFRQNLELTLKQTHANRVIFIDDTFNVPKSRFKALCASLVKMDIEWYSFLRVQYVDEETVKLMKASGCAMVYLGIESSNDTILKNMNKKATRLQFEQGVHLLKKYDIPVMAAFVIGFPGETEQTARENVAFIESTGVDFYSLKEFYYMHHTPIHDSREKYQLKGDGASWEHATMTSQQASELKISMFREIKGATAIDPDTSMWYIAYLNDQGYSMPQIKAVQKEINRLTIDQLDGNFDHNSPAFSRITDIVKGVST